MSGFALHIARFDIHLAGGVLHVLNRPREKGIDVMIALQLVQQAQSGPCNVVILASHDTDMEPALEMAARVGRVKIETAGWGGSRRLRIPGRNLWHTALSAGDFVLVRDRRNYG